DQGSRRREPMPRPEAYNPGMLQETADDALDGNVFRQALDPRAQAAHSPDYQGNRDAGPGRPIERVDHVDIGQLVELCPNRGGPTSLCMCDLGCDQIEELCLDAEGRYRNLFEPRRAGIAGDEIEEPS